MKYLFTPLIAFCFSQPALAIVDPLNFSPPDPSNLDFITFRSSARLCHNYGAQVGAPIIQSNVIKVFSIGAVRTDFALCNFRPSNVFGQIGYLPPGNYSVELYIEDFTGFGTFLVRTDPLRVGVGIVQAPAFSSWSLLALLLGVGGIGWYAARRG
jgi:hypothetical protein